MKVGLLPVAVRVGSSLTPPTLTVEAMFSVAVLSSGTVPKPEFDHLRYGDYPVGVGRDPGWCSL